MSYKELFSAIECNRIVIIEDDFKQGEYKKERALYDITRMAVDDRCRYLAEIESISQPLHEVLSKFLSLFDECFNEIGVWDDSIPYGDISCAFGLVESVNPKLKVLLGEQYAATDEAIQPDNRYRMSGNQISVKTLDLNKNFSEISAQLNRIVEDHFL